MRPSQGGKLAMMAAAGMLLAGCSEDQLEPTTSGTGFHGVMASQVASMYVADFVGTAADGWGMNNAGDVVGRSYRDIGCGSFCLPPEDVVVWRGGNRIQLPLVPGYASSYQWPFYINNNGLIGGFVGLPGSATHAAVWIPGGTGYTAQDLGVFPGTTSAEVFGLDDLGRMVGWSTKGGAIPTIALPFMWSQATGMVDLTALGYPSERPAAMSPGGKVVTWGSWYQLGNPASVVPLPPTPRGFIGPSRSVINDNGDQAHFLTSTSTQNLVYPFRLSKGGTWQQLSSAGTGMLSRAGLGSINAAQDISFTVLSTGMIAPGPAGVGQPLAALLSPAYPGATIGNAGPMNNAGQILAKVMIGRSQRLMKLTPAAACGANCLVSSSLVMTGVFVQDPAFPGSCFQGGTMYNLATATATLTSETGAPLASVQVSGRFLDDYWTNHPVTGTTNASGVVTWTYRGLCGVGAIAFLVEKATLGTRSFDRTRGIVSSWVIPGTTPPANQPPVSRPVVTCSGMTCTFDGRGSTDDVGITAYEWYAGGPSIISSQPVFSFTFSAGRTRTWSLTVRDGGGLSNSANVTFTVPSSGTPPPVASFTFSCTYLTCSFDGAGSTAQSNATYSWAWGDGTANGSGKTATHSYAAAGNYSVTLTVSDAGGSSSRTQAVTVTAPPPTNQPPVSRPVVTCSGMTCTFDGRGSTDDVGITAYEWYAGGPSIISSQPVFSFTFSAGRTRTWSLMVRDGGGLSSSANVTFTVPAP